MSKTVCAVMVSHNPAAKVVQVATSLLSQVDHLVIVDNASCPESRRHLRSVVQLAPTRVTIVFNPENVWMAAALNQGIEWAKGFEFDFVLFASDADLISENAVQAQMRAFREQAPNRRIGSANPRVLLADIPIEIPPLDQIRDVSFPVTGGCLVSMEAIRNVGVQREDFLIDFVDFDFALRLQAAGYRTVQLDGITLAGELGRTTKRRLWRARYCDVHNYSAVRRYYFARNGLVLMRETKNRELARFYLRFLLSSIAKIAIFETDRRHKIVMILRGIADGLRGNLGPVAGGTRAHKATRGT